MEKLKHEANRKIFEYIALLESSNDSLLNTLKQCVSLLSQFTEVVPNPESFRDLLEHLNQIIQTGERVVTTKETLH